MDVNSLINELKNIKKRHGNIDVNFNIKANEEEKVYFSVDVSESCPELHIEDSVEE